MWWWSGRLGADVERRKTAPSPGRHEPATSTTPGQATTRSATQTAQSSAHPLYRSQFLVTHPHDHTHTHPPTASASLSPSPLSRPSNTTTMPTPESSLFLAQKPKVPATFDGVDYDNNQQLKA